MQEKLLFEYAVIRIVPRVEREEFLNVGVVLFAHARQFLGVRWQLDEQRVAVLFPGIDVSLLRTHLSAFEKIALGAPDSGPIGRLDPPSRFRWLTAKRSTMVQCSMVHPGFCNDPAGKLQQLFNELVALP